MVFAMAREDGLFGKRADDGFFAAQPSSILRPASGPIHFSDAKVVPYSREHVHSVVADVRRYREFVPLRRVHSVGGNMMGW